MKLPIRNRGSKPLTLIIELIAEEYEVSVGGDAVVTLEDGYPHSIEMGDDCMIIYDGAGTYADVEIFTPSLTN